MLWIGGSVAADMAPAIEARLAAAGVTVHDGAPDRKPDGVHVCPQGAARFADWFAARLAERYDGLATAAPQWLSGPLDHRCPLRHARGGLCGARRRLTGSGRPREASAASLTCDEAWAR